MKKLFIALFAMLVVAGVGYTQTVSTANFAYPLPVSDKAFSEVLSPATATLTLSDVATAMPAMPAGTKAVSIKAINGAVCWGPSSMVIPTNNCSYMTIASDSEVFWNYNTINPKSAAGIYFINKASGTPAIVRFTPVR